MSYKELLKRPEWKEKREIILERDGYKCKTCGKTKHLQVHHKKYIPNRMPWHYSNKHLVTLCATCHKSEHVLDDEKFANNIKAVATDDKILHNEMRHRMHGTIDQRPKIKKTQSLSIKEMNKYISPPPKKARKIKAVERHKDVLGSFAKKANKMKSKKYRKVKFEEMIWGRD